MPKKQQISIGERVILTPCQWVDTCTYISCNDCPAEKVKEEMYRNEAFQWWKNQPDVEVELL